MIDKKRFAGLTLVSARLFSTIAAALLLEIVAPATRIKDGGICKENRA